MLSTQYANLKLVIFDEISLIGRNIFNFVDTRLRAIMHNHNKPLGDLDVILCGDLCQASPIRDTWIFKNDDSLLTTFSSSFWTSKVKYFELTQPMRQDNIAFLEILNKIRVGEQTDDDLRQINTIYCKRPENILQTSYLFFKNTDKDKHNNEIFNRIPTLPHIIQCIDKRHKTCSKKIKIPLSPKDTGDLHTCLLLKPTMLVELCAGNIDILDGLVNGADGVFQTADTITTPPIVWIQFSSKKIGQHCRNQSEHLYKESTCTKWTPIQQITKEFQIGQSHLNIVSRTQFPIQPAAARTIHRAQGTTLSNLAFDPKHIHSHGLVYNALSRIKDPKNLYILDKLTHSQIKVDKIVLEEINRLKTTSPWECTNQALESYNLTHFILQTLNTVSFKKHKKDIEADRSLMASDIICLQETGSLCNDSEIRDFKIASLFQTHGVAILYNNNQKMIIEILTIQFTSNKIGPIYISNLYRSPTTTIDDLIEILELVMSTIPDNKEQIIVGDFNLDPTKCPRKFTTLFNLMKQHHYTQQITQPTTNHGTTLDHIWTNIHNKKCIVGTNYSYWSDHSIAYSLVENTNLYHS